MSPVPDWVWDDSRVERVLVGRSFEYVPPVDADRLFSAVAAGENVVSASVRLGYSLPEVLELLAEQAGDYMAALRKVPRRILVS